MQDLSALHMNELISLYHADDSMVDGLGILVALHHFLVELGIRNFGANRNATLDCILDLADHRHQLDWCLDSLGSHTTLGRVEG